MDVKAVIKGKGTRKKSGGGKKIGRNAAKCKRYRDLGIRENNKARKARKELKKSEKLAAKRARK